MKLLTRLWQRFWDAIYGPQHDIRDVHRRPYDPNPAMVIIAKCPVCDRWANKHEGTGQVYPHGPEGARCPGVPAGPTLHNPEEPAP